MYSQFEDFNFGWGSESLDKFKFEDFELNGQYCKSGLAFYNKDLKAGQCANTYKVMQGDKVLKAPYQCDPTDNELPCKIFYTKDKSFDVPCNCALDGKEVDGHANGYCSSILGTAEYAEALVKLKSV